MSRDVQILPQTLINKIAAGEVIVRPASVVKELVENAFDAEARHVRVEVSRDGRSISVSDDGCGMDEPNARRAILRNSTSKIRDFEDLERLTTRGFRGEALASIISVSRFELLTRRPEDTAGVRILASGGQVEKVQPTGTAAGTTLHVRDLFYNTPARLKFLKSPASEFNILTQLLTQQAFSHPDVGLTLVRDGAVRFDLPAGQDLRSRIEELLGPAVQGQLIPVRFERAGLRVEGFVCRPEASRKDRRWQYLMINGRPIAARQMAFPIQEAYQGLLMKNRFPVVVLDIRVDLAEVDVNVHPTKDEVRFEDERKVAGLLHRAIHDALVSHNLMPSLELTAPPPAFAEGAAALLGAQESESGGENPQDGGDVPFRGTTPPLARPGGSSVSHPADDPSLPFLFSPKGVAPFSPQSGERPGGRDFSTQSRDLFPPHSFPARRPSSSGDWKVNGPEAAGSSPSPDRGLSPVLNSMVEDFPYEPEAGTPPSVPTPPSQQEEPFVGCLHRDGGIEPIPLGQVARTYIVAEWGEDLLVIDQHAAHERLLYDRLRSRSRAAVQMQTLLIPIPLEVGPAEAGAVEALLPILREMGVEVQSEESGGFCVTALPSDFDSINVSALVRDLIDEYQELDLSGKGLAQLRDQALIRMACHTAIRAGQTLHPDEMRALLHELAEARVSFTCPHGRPTMTLLRKDQLDRQFGRIV